MLEQHPCEYMEAAARGFPFIIEKQSFGTTIDNYTIRDRNGDRWAICTNADQAETLLAGLQMLDAAWRGLTALSEPKHA